MADALATSFTCTNYSGLLYTKSNTKTPLLNSIGERRISPSVEFVIDQTYALGTASQPAISETASATAPDATTVTRTQQTNVCQIFHETVGSTYAHESNMGTLGGANIAGQTPNPVSELDWQIAQRMKKIAQDIEYTCLNGAYNKATSDATINKTRGIIAACTSNVLENVSQTTHTPRDVSTALLKDLCKSVFNNGGEVNGCIMTMNADMRVKISNLYENKTGYIMPASRTVFGIAADTLVTEFGTVYLITNTLMPAGKILLYNPSVIRPVEMIVPGKGNFFYEELSKTGAATKGQIFGQFGLDYGPEWFHGVLADLN